MLKIIFYLITLLCLAACGSVNAPQSAPRRVTVAPVLAATPDETALIREGETLFLRWCSGCHGIGGVGNVGPAFTDWLVLPVDFVQLRVRQGPQVMYEFSPTDVPDADVAKIGAYLAAEVVGTSLVERSAEELAQGRELYLTYCTECHGSLGFGKQDVGPVLNIYPPMSITRIVEGGLLPLPGMPRLTITPDELRLVAAYIQNWAK
jgi:mono/diheme cytochrome c family protein